ncbi:MAG TPA: hypothetical protein VG295_06970 [Solirubrobacteraceae bacterium]|jgi:hypothetical protein|nr:hypothetical protein [Solirubrobacteraceae bacterium]
MTSLAIERLGPPASIHDARVLKWAGRQAAHALAGRTVWCACTSPAARAAADGLLEHLRPALEDGITSRAIGVEVDEPLLRLTQRLESMLAGPMSADRPLGAEEIDVYAGRAEESEGLIGPDMREGDVVVLHDPFTASLGQAARARGAHVVWSFSTRPAQRKSAADAWRFLSRWRAPLDAYVTLWHAPEREQRVGIAAYISAPDAVSAKVASGDPERRYEDLGWASVLADIVSTDREERVGGRLHARPAVAVH